MKFNFGIHNDQNSQHYQQDNNIATTNKPQSE